MKLNNFYITTLLVFIFCFQSVAQEKINGGFEKTDSVGNAIGWDFTLNNRNTYLIGLDSVTKRTGKYSLCIDAGNKPIYANVVKCNIADKLNGDILSLVGTIKTENVKDGFAGLWIRVDNGRDQLALETMENQNLNGTHDWKEYAVQIPYDKTNATSIKFGTLLTGKGKAWFDDLKLYVDGVPIDQVKPTPIELIADTLFDQSSKIDTILNTSRNINYLAITGKLWSFLKYYHPAVTAGNFNWDQKLFELIPSILKLENDESYKVLIENWVKSLGNVQYSSKPNKDKGEFFLEADYGDLFTTELFPKNLKERLKFISKNTSNKRSHYVSLTPNVGNPHFDNEKLYAKKSYPDAGIRLLALYRYWAIINYFSPNRNLIDTDWNKVLEAFIPEIIGAKDKYEYHKTLAKLISLTKDGHAFLVSDVLQDYVGKYILPLNARYIEDKLVVSGFYKHDVKLENQFKKGDIIERINGALVTDLIKKYLPLTSASNFSSAMRDMPEVYFLRSQKETYKLDIIRNNIPLTIFAEGCENKSLRYSRFFGKPEDKAFYLLNKDIGYVLGSKFKRTSLDSIVKEFTSTKGIILDMRGYPTEDIAGTIGRYLVQNKATPFVKTTQTSTTVPGRFIVDEEIKTQESLKYHYFGKVVVLVNELTQSNAEFVTMALQTSPNVMVIGSTTAGADGNISDIFLPGGFKTEISGIGILYPDGTNAQQKGVKLDEFVKPTINGIKNGIDEVLERAKEIILQRWR
ncbi:C-terminal processing protease CtpA/Prc [Pedobacter sp. UYP30]|uniref:S41 family peptidase n=1 Tax=Pedobacter sp. UYP30 TaxID=1756400 RepID=UPI0033933200